MSKDRKTKRIHTEAKAVDTALRDLLAKPDGRLLVWWLLTITNHGQQPFTANALTTSFNCGVQNVGQQLLARIMAVAPESYIKLLEERKDAGRNDRDDDAGGYDYADPRESVTYLADDGDDGDNNRD